MAKNTANQELMQEAFHTYQTFLACMKIDVGGVGNVPLLKWPDIAQSALNYAEALEAQDSEEAGSARSMLRMDLCIAIASPIESMHRSTKEHVKKHLGKSPQTKILSQEERYKFPIKYKNNLIDDLNNMFKTLSTMTGVDYPELRKRNKNGSSS